MVRPTVIGGDVDRADLMPALRFDGVHERIALRGKSVVGGQHQKWHRNKTGSSVLQSKRFGVGVVLVSHALSGDTGQAFHAVGHLSDQLFAGLLAENAHVSRRDQDRADQSVIVGRGVRGYPAPHAVSGDGDSLRINPQASSIHRVAQVGEDSVGILQVLGEAVNAGLPHEPR